MRIESTTDTAEQVAEANKVAIPAPGVETPSGSAAASGAVEKTATDTATPPAENLDADPEEELEEEENGEPNAEANAAKPGKKGLQKRFGELTRAKTEAQHKAQLAEERAAHWEKIAKANGVQTEKPAVTPAATPTGLAEGEPDPEKFEKQSEYLRAYAKWSVDSERKTAETNAKAQAMANERNTRIQTYQSKSKEFEKTHADFATVLQAADEVAGDMNPAIEDVVLTSENGHELLYELAKDKDEYVRINKMSPRDAILAMGEFKAGLKFKAANKPAPNKITNAPTPISPVGTRSSGSKKKVEDMSMAEYTAMREAEGARY